MDKFAEFHFGNWALTVPMVIDRNLKKSLLIRKSDSPELILNFDPQVGIVIKYEILLKIFISLYEIFNCSWLRF